ncbi:MAG: isopentenyl phosphate kinase [Parcubacteria group bacterium]|jgi:isopentenyl phosphate kinase
MKNISIIKIGGSIITDKSSHKLIVHRELLHDIAKELHQYLLKKPRTELIIIHGAGGPGHHIAHQHGLADGTLHDPVKIRAVCDTRLVNQKLNTEICEILLQNDIPVIPAHTGTLITQKNKEIVSCDLSILQSILGSNCIPVLYGEMVHDAVLEYSVCSGDTSAAYLAQHLPVEKIFFATDVDGIFDRDPHKFPEAQLIPNISLHDIYNDTSLSIERSHNTDVTGGLRGKLSVFQSFADHAHTLKEIIIFNGTDPKKYHDVLTGTATISTRITL